MKRASIAVTMRTSASCAETSSLEPLQAFVVFQLIQSTHRADLQGREILHHRAPQQGGIDWVVPGPKPNAKVPDAVPGDVGTQDLSPLAQANRHGADDRQRIVH